MAAMKMPHPRILAPFALLLVLLLSACNSMPKVKLDTKREYANAVRWSDWDMALKFVDPLTRLTTTISQEELDRLKDIKVTGYEVKSSETLPDGSLHQTVEIRFVEMNTQVERSKRVPERWRLDEDGHVWWLTTGLPEF